MFDIEISPVDLEIVIITRVKRKCLPVARKDASARL